MGNRDRVGIVMVLVFVIVLSLTACAGSQGPPADAPVSSLTLVPSATPGTTPSAVPTEVVPSISPTVPPPFFPDINNIGSDWVVEVSDPAELGEEKTYTHYPTTPPQYDELLVDDELLAVDYVCMDETRDLSGWFAPGDEAVDGIVPYKSWPIDFFRQGCRIDFTVKNTQGDTIGLRFTAHCPTCHN